MGGASFIGQLLTNALLNSTMNFDALLMADIVVPLCPGKDQGIICLRVNLSESGAAKNNKQQA